MLYYNQLKRSFSLLVYNACFCAVTMLPQLRSEDGWSSLSLKSVVSIPTGVSSLDAILGSGFPLGSLVLIEEDELGIYSEILLKCFLSEGIANSDSIFLACGDNPKRIINELPQAVPRKEDLPQTSEGDLKIAWRYQNIQQVVSEPSLLKNTSVSHDFDFTSKVQEETLKKSDISMWLQCHSGNGLSQLFQDIFKHVSSKKLQTGIGFRFNRKLVRVVVQSLGSPFWFVDNKAISKFLFQLRTTLHNSFSVGLVTIPSRLLGNDTLNKCKQLSDVFISFKSFLNSTDPSFKEYSGLIKLNKISAVNSISIHVPEDVDWGFKVKRKKMIFEKLHLPPETNVTDQREQDDSASVAISNCQLSY